MNDHERKIFWLTVEMVILMMKALLYFSPGSFGVNSQLKFRELTKAIEDYKESL